MDQTLPQIAILPSPGMGHLIPLGEFAKKLTAQHNFSVTIILPTDGPLPKAQKSLLESLPPRIRHLLLPPVNLDDLPDDVKIETRISLTVTRSLPHLRDALRSLSSAAAGKLAALVVDLFATDAFDVASEFNVSNYIFYPTTATTLSFFRYLPELHETVPLSCEFRDLPGPVLIPGSVPIQGRDLLDPAQDRQNDAYKWVLHHSRRYSLAEGIVVNTFEDLEPGPLEALQDRGDEEQQPGKPPVYPVGPLIQGGGAQERSECLKWLEQQPSGSVLYISFGSGGTLSHAQMIELAWGLELSEQRFLWVVRSPNDTIANASYFNSDSQNDPLSFLPEGFTSRTRGKGCLVASWAPQASILRHASTGGFLTHCGWNSTLESVVEGVPLIAWPLYAEQKMNAVMLAEDLKVALRPRQDEKGLIGRTEIANVVKGLMEGEEGKKLRSRMTELKEGANKVLSNDGSSTKALAQLANKWKTKVSCA